MPRLAVDRPATPGRSAPRAGWCGSRSRERVAGDHAPPSARRGSCRRFRACRSGGSGSSRPGRPRPGPRQRLRRQRRGRHHDLFARRARSSATSCCGSSSRARSSCSSRRRSGPARARDRKGLMGLIRERWGVRWGAFAAALMLAANLGSTVAEFAGISAALGLFGVPAQISAAVAAVIVVGVHRPRQLRPRPVPVRRRSGSSSRSPT